MSGSIFKCKPTYKDGKILVGYIPAYPPYWSKPLRPVSYTCKGQLLALPSDHPAYQPFDVEEWSATKDYILWDCVKAWYPGNGYSSPARWMYFVNRLSGHTNYNFNPIANPEPCAQRWQYSNHWQEYTPCGGNFVPDWSPTYPIWDRYPSFKYGGKYWWCDILQAVGGEEPPFFAVNPPSEAGQWNEYIPSLSGNYLSIPPFGGIGKSPAKYIVSVIEKYRNVDYLGLYIDKTANYQVVLDYGMWGKSYFSFTTYVTQRQSNGTYANTTEGWSGSMWLSIGNTGVELKRQYQNFTTTLLHNRKRHPVEWDYYEAWPFCNEGCVLKGTRGDTRVFNFVDQNQRPYSYTLQTQVSWRPEDCTYTVWNNTSVYNFDACVSYLGKFFKACIVNGPGTPAGVVAPQDTDPESCNGTNVWMVV